MSHIFPANSATPPERATRGSDGNTSGKLVNALANDLNAVLTLQLPNVAFSPTSIALTLAMVEEGARNRTDAEIRKVLHANSDEQLEQLADLGKHLATMNGANEVLLSNRAYIDKKFPIERTFLDALSRRHAADAATLNLSSQPESSRETINTWVSERTHHKIESLLPTGSITSETRMVLVNAIYFKGTWATPFDSKKTQAEPFHCEAKKAVTVQMMKNVITTAFASTEAADVLRLEYESGAFALDIVLPKPGVRVLNMSLEATLASYEASLARSRVDVWLPKFTVKYNAALSDALKQLGMRTAFTNDADFTGISRKSDLSIGNVFHATNFDVDERGTEAAAATATTFRIKSARPELGEVKVFHADRPFLFLLRELQTGAILFAGRLTDPAI